MNRKRHLLPATLLALVGLAGSTPAVAGAAGSQVIHADVPLAQCYGVKLALDFTVPATTAPGESVAVSDVSATIKWRTGVTTMPGTWVPANATPTINGLSFKTSGAQATSVALSGLPRTLGTGSVSEQSSDGYGYDAVSPTLGSTPATTTSGAAPVVIRLEKFNLSTVFSGFLGPGLGTPPTSPWTRISDCVQSADSAPLAVIPSTGAVPSAPTITSLSQSSGPLVGGNTITIKGTNLASTAAVKVAGAYGGSFVVKDDQTVELTVPQAQVPGQTTLTVLTDFGTSMPVSYTYEVPCETDCEPEPEVFNYSLQGSATLKTLVKGSLPLRGSLDAVTFDPQSTGFSADLFLEQSTGNLVALGFLPVTAQVLFLPTAPMVGSLEGGVLTAVQKSRIQIPKVTLFGIPLAGGVNCQAKQVSNIALKSAAPNFVPATGGVLAGTFAISDLAGCGALTGIISPLTAGKSNAMALSLTPVTYPEG